MPNKINEVDSPKPARPTLRQLLMAARERLGQQALGLKTREELTQALDLEPRAPAPVVLEESGRPPIVVRDFFVRR